jgi:hypothetical protein
MDQFLAPIQIVFHYPGFDYFMRSVSVETALKKWPRDIGGDSGL